MRNLNKLFENKNIEYEKLLDYGFILNSNKYIYESLIYDANFKLLVEISEYSKTSKLIDLTTNEEYILVDVKSTGDFIGTLKEEYDNVLNDIIAKCSSPNIFTSPQSIKVIKYIKEKYNSDLEYLWHQFPNNAVWRNKENNKWYGIMLVLSENKLGLDSDKVVDIIDLRYQKELIKELVDNQNIFKGYHMNKDNWITIRLDGSVDIKEIYKLIDNSYILSLKK